MKFAVFKKSNHYLSRYFPDGIIKIHGRLNDSTGAPICLAEKHSLQNEGGAVIKMFLDSKVGWESYSGAPLKDYQEKRSSYLWIVEKDLEFVSSSNKELKSVLQGPED